MGHFDFLFEKRGGVSPDTLELLAKTAARRYVSQSVPLNDSIAKLAREHGLNGEQIDRVCEKANIETHRALWPAASEKVKVAFDLADSKKVKPAASGGRPAGLPSNSGPSDFDTPPKGLPTPGAPSMDRMFGVDGSAGHSGLAGASPKQNLLIMLQKKTAAKRDLSSKLVMAGIEGEELVKRAFATVKQAVLGGETFRRIFDAAREAGLGKTASDLLPKFERKLIGESFGSERARLEKVAISRAPLDLVSDQMPGVTVVNGAHPVLVSLDTVRRKSDEMQNIVLGIMHIDDEVKVYEQRLQEL